jgi:signal transduction histidine kinase
VPLAPLAVVVLGAAVAFGIAVVGVDHLAREGEEHAGRRAELVAATLAAKLSALAEPQRLEAARVASRRTEASMLIVAADGTVAEDLTHGAPSLATLPRILADKRGVVRMPWGRARFAVEPVAWAGTEVHGDVARVVVFVAEPHRPVAANALLRALLALTVMVLGVAAAVAHAVSRDLTRDVDFITRRVTGMTQVRTEPTGALVPARTMDEVGLLTSAFNKLVGRFGRADRAYRLDLERASAADAERAAFLAAVSHELRSPLNAILGFADILMEEVDGPLSPTAREEVEQIRGSGAHLAALINDILEFSALESGQLKLTLRTVNIAAVAREVVREASVLVGDKSVALRVEGEHQVLARVDARRVRQILSNLVANATKFTQRGEIIVRVFLSAPFAVLQVVDTGPGIPPEERALIFLEYKQASGERLKRRGTGLGLAIARRLVMLHHGSIFVDSEPGRGAVFTVRLPIGNIDTGPVQLPALVVRGGDGAR